MSKMQKKWLNYVLPYNQILQKSHVTSLKGNQNSRPRIEVILQPSVYSAETISWKICVNNRFKSSENYSASISIDKIPNLSLENPKLIMSMISGFLNLSPSPKTNYLSLGTPIHLREIKKKPEDFPKYYFCKSQKWEIQHFYNFGKGKHRQMMKIRLIKSGKSWIWDQHLPEPMK